MKTIIIASILALTNDPTGGSAGGPTCEEQLFETQADLYEAEDSLFVAEDVIEAAVYWAESAGASDPAGGGAQPCDTQICTIVDNCRASGTDDLGKCVAEACAETDDNCL